MSAHLTILHYNPYPWYWVAVEGHIPMNQWDTQGYINNGARIELRLYGADLGYWPDNHDLMYGPYFENGGWGGGSGQLWADRTASTSSAPSSFHVTTSTRTETSTSCSSTPSSSMAMAARET